MRVVLYAHDMEPITILELRQWQYEFLIAHGRVRLPVYPQMASLRVPDETMNDTFRFWAVEITAERWCRNRQEHLMLFTHQEEHALLLKSAFLPGQRSTLKEHERESFVKGFLAALECMR